MKKLYLLWFCLLPALTAEAQVILVPADYPTIQHGINAAADGFTILVSPGIYVENIDFNGKNITVASLFLTTQDTSYISQTIIDGNHTGSVVTFKTGEDSTAQLCGFTIINGYGYYGGGIYCDGASPNLNNLVVTENSAYGHFVPRWYYVPGFGGGIYFNNSTPVMQNILIKNNTTTDNGGGIYSSSSSLAIANVVIRENSAGAGGGIFIDFESTVELEDVTICHNNAVTAGGGIHTEYDYNVQFDSINRCNIYCNEADIGNDLYFNSYWLVMLVIVDTFTVLNPTIYHAAPFEYFTFDILHGKNQQVDADLYVSPAGNNENDGLSPQTPLKTIHHAFSLILTDSIHQNTIHLLEGTYSDSANGERFPVVLPDYISLEGGDPASVILDGSVGYVISITGNQWNRLAGMTIKDGHGWAAAGPPGGSEAGGGIYCYQSSPVLENLAVTANYSLPGGPLYFIQSNPVIKDVTIYDNNSEHGYGGGISCENSVISMMNSTISGNYGNKGGGIVSIDSYLNLENITFSDNTGWFGGGINCEGSTLYVENSKISNNSSYYYGGGVYCSGSAVVLNDVLITENISKPTYYGYGGGIYCQASELTLTNATLADNSGTLGGGIYAIGANTITLANCILWNDEPQEIYYTPQAWPYGSAKVITVEYSDIKGGAQAVITNNLVTLNWLEGNIDSDPQFAGGTVDPYSLFWLSPCVDAGTPDTLGLNLPPGDISGNLRVWDGNWDGTAVIDMGAYEYGSVPVGIEGPELTGQQPGSGLKCYPVPANTMITIETPFYDHQGLITISDLNGKNLSVLPVTGPETVIDISALQQGVYFVRVKNEKMVEVGKIVKQ